MQKKLKGKGVATLRRHQTQRGEANYVNSLFKAVAPSDFRLRSLFTGILVVRPVRSSAQLEPTIYALCSVYDKLFQSVSSESCWIQSRGKFIRHAQIVAVQLLLV